MLLCLGEFAGPLVELLLEVDCSGTVTTRSGRLCSAVELRRIAAARFHRFAARGLAGPAANPPINAMNSRRLMGITPRPRIMGLTIAGQGRASQQKRAAHFRCGSFASD